MEVQRQHIMPKWVSDLSMGEIDTQINDNTKYWTGGLIGLMPSPGKCNLTGQIRLECEINKVLSLATHSRGLFAHLEIQSFVE